MEVNVYRVATVLPFAKWALMCAGMRKEDRILQGLPVWVAVYVHLFVPEVC